MTSKGTTHHFEDEVIEKAYQDLIRTVDLRERQRLAQAIGDHLFEAFADMPLILLFNEVMVNPKVVGEWVYPGTGAGRSTHFHLLQATQ